MTGILFDLDGTLLNTLEDLTDATNFVLRASGFPERSMEQVRQAVGNGAARLIRKSLPEGTPEETVGEILAAFQAYYTQHCQVKTRPYNGVAEALEILAQQYPVAIVSNKPDSAVKALCGEYFPGIYALGETSDCPRKPAPDMVYRAMKAIGADSCIYVGDSEVDVLTAQNAGVCCLSVLWGFRDRADCEAAGAVYFCEEPIQMVEKLEELIHGK